MARHPFYHSVSAFLAVGLALVLALIDSQMHPQADVFSKDSLTALRELNYQYQMSVEDLRASSEDSLLISQLYQADALIPNQDVDRSNTGLVVSLKEDDSLLLLQPIQPLSTEELEKVAQAYEKNVAEIARVELDQTVSMESPVYGWTPTASDEPVSLTSDPTETPVEAAPLDLASELELATIKVAVIDSGIDTTHEIFSQVSLLPGWNTITGNDEVYDDVGHGTHVAGIVASQAPGVTIVPYKIVDSNGGKLSNVLEAFSHAIGDHVDVINASFGISSESYALQAMVESAQEQGIILVSAAGNSGSDTDFFPAHYSDSVAVASVDSTGHKLPNSNYGDWIDVAAKGYHIRSSLPNNEYGYKTGTSQATPFVSAAVARLLMADPTLTVDQVLALLDESPVTIADGTLAGTPIVE